MSAKQLVRYLHVSRIWKRGVSTRKRPFDSDEVLVSDTIYNSKIHVDVSKIPKFDSKLISYLERLSLVRFDSEQAVANLRKAVEMALRLDEINTENVEPMYTVWEDQKCPVFEDSIEEPLKIDEVFRNCAERYDDYFVTPPGNVPLEANDRLDVKMINEWDTLGKPVAPHVKPIKLAENKE